MGQFREEVNYVYVSPLSKNCPGEVGVRRFGGDRRSEAGRQNGVDTSRGSKRRLMTHHLLQPVAATGWYVPNTNL